MIEFIHEHHTLLLSLSIGGFLGSMIVIPWILIQIPPDYFSSSKRKKYRWHHYPPIIRSLLILLKNTLGVILIIAGVIMLFTPGQGILTIIAGIIFTDFPYKYRILRWIIKHPKIVSSINHLRKKAKKDLLEI